MSNIFHSTSDDICRKYLDSLLILASYIDSVPADLHVSLFGKTFASPFMIAPFMPAFANPDEGTRGLVRAVAETGTIFFATHMKEDELRCIREAKIPYVQNIKPLRDTEEMERRIRKAESDGAFAFFIDIDQVFTSRTGCYANFSDRPDYIPDRFHGDSGKLTAETLHKYVNCSSLPLIIKGIISPKDALLCKEAGVAAVYLSHHHGALEYAVPPVSALPAVREVVGMDYPIMCDSGIETGIDVFKALALGADFVLAARHLIPVFREKGSDGVVKRMEEINAELKYYMAITHSTEVRHIRSSSLVHNTF